MKVIGLTGRSGSGKGYVCALLNARGIPSIDTDRIVHSLYDPGTPCVAELTSAFGPEILSPDGSVNRKILAGIVFSDPGRLTLLNGIVHRYVLMTVRDLLRALEENGVKIAVVDAPQLFESGYDGECDFTIAVIADRDVCLQRLQKRDRLPVEQIENRMKNQHGDEFFEEKCDFVIRNSGTEDLSEQLDAILSGISDGEGRKP